MLFFKHVRLKTIQGLDVPVFRPRRTRGKVDNQGNVIRGQGSAHKGPADT